MIEITRALARQCRAVFRKAIPRNTNQNAHWIVTFESGQHGLRVRTNQDEVAVEYQHPGTFKAETLDLPGEALANFEGRKQEIVTLSAVEDGVQARWFDAGVPQTKEYPRIDIEKMPAFPDAPTQWSDPGPGFLKALDDAFHCAAREAVRFALTHLQLRGSKGEIHATDGRQALIQGGFSFPFREDVLVPAIAAFGSRDLPLDEAVAIGVTQTHLGIRIGAWIFLLAIEKEKRYPDVAAVMPSPHKPATLWRLPTSDAEFLARTLPRLPGGGDDDSPVTVDLNGRAAVRVRPEGEKQITEVLLSQSEITGAPVRFRSSRCFLERALALGMGAFRVVNADTPVVAADEQRKYVWMLLDKSRCVPPTDDAVRITSTAAAQTTDQPRKERRKAVKAPSNRQDHREEGPVQKPSEERPKVADTSIAALIEESQALKELLRDAFRRMQRLGAGLRRHRQQSRTFRAALTSLKQLQHIDP